MKKILIATAVFFSSQTFAISIDDFCSQFSWDNEKIECHKTAGRNYIDTKALDICNTFSFDNDKMNCLKTILNKSYTQGESKLCNDQSFESEKLKCLVDLGTQYQRPNDPRKLETIRKLTITAQDYLRQNDTYNTARALDQIYQLTTTP